MPSPKTFERSGQPRTALREYTAFLELFPADRQSEEVRQRIEYLREFTVLDRAGLNRALQQAWIDELSGKSRQLVLLEVARVLFSHHDFVTAAQSFKHYATAYPDDHNLSEAQYFLAESLLRLSRQRELEAEPASADSLRILALGEYRVLVEQNLPRQHSARRAIPHRQHLGPTRATAPYHTRSRGPPRFATAVNARSGNYRFRRRVFRAPGGLPRPSPLAASAMPAANSGRPIPLPLGSTRPLRPTTNSTGALPTVRSYPTLYTARVFA